MKAITEAHLAILRRHMVEVIAIHAELAGEELGKAELDERVMAALRRVPRHRFVPASLAPHAYQDTPLPIGFDKTISQPFLVALMTEPRSWRASPAGSGAWRCLRSSRPRPSCACGS